MKFFPQIWSFARVFTVILVGVHIQGVTSLLNITLGVILPESTEHPWSLKRVLPAIEYAVQNVAKRGILPGAKLVPLTKDSQCSEVMGPLAAVDFHVNDSVKVFLGPVCEYAIAPVARYSPYWNIPVLSAGAFPFAFDNKSEYRQLTRVHLAYTTCADFFVYTAQNFNWTTLGLIYHDFEVRKGKGMSDCFFQIEAFFYRLKNVFVRRPWNKKFDETLYDDNDYVELLKEASQNARSKLRHILRHDKCLQAFCFMCIFTSLGITICFLVQSDHQHLHVPNKHNVSF